VPFYPDVAAALRSARFFTETWPTVRNYGHCPWNTLSGMLTEFGMTSDEFVAMHADQMSEAMMLTTRYPMVGALTEYHGNPEGWRGLPFQTGTLLNALCGLVLKGLPMGVAARGSDLVTEARNYTYRAAAIDAVSTGRGDEVQSIEVNGTPLRGSLQIPEELLRAGRNTVRIVRGTPPDGPRLHGSTARLFGVAEGRTGTVYRMGSPTRADLVFESLDAARLRVTDAAGDDLAFETRAIEDTGKTLVIVPADGDFVVHL
jgi:hypothetical protein